MIDCCVLALTYRLVNSMIMRDITKTRIPLTRGIFSNQLDENLSLLCREYSF
jgi:hypothetical protein